MFDLNGLREAPQWAQYMMYALMAIAVGVVAAWRVVQVIALYYYKTSNNNNDRNVIGNYGWLMGFLAPHLTQIAANRDAIVELRHRSDVMNKQIKLFHEENKEDIKKMLDKLT